MEKNKKIGLLFLAAGLVLIAFMVIFVVQITRSDRQSEQELHFIDSLNKSHSDHHQHE
jgi:hypothetical protein